MDINNDYFDFICPTRMIYKVDGISTIGQIISKEYNFKKVFLVYGSKSLKETGNYLKITTSLKENKIDFIEYGNIQANPDVSDVNNMIKMARDFNPELILACGGGSVLDAAKALAHGYYYLGDVLDFPKHIVKPLKALPVATIITLAASGSEMSDSCVISDRKHGFKGGFNTPTNYPLFSLLDPTLTYSVSKYQTSIGLVDMFSHSFERFFSPSKDIEPCDNLAIAVMKGIVDVSRKVLDNPNDYEARRGMLLLGSLAHNGITSYGKNKKMIVHGAEHRLSGKYPSLAHGQGIGLLLVPYLKKNKTLYKEKIHRLGVEVFSLSKSSSTSKCIQALEDWLNSLDMYHSFEELPFKVEEIDINKAYNFLKIK